MLIPTTYALAAALCAELGEAGGSGWLNALTMFSVCNAMKFIVAGPVTLIRLVSVRRRETRPMEREAQLQPRAVEFPFDDGAKTVTPDEEPGSEFRSTRPGVALRTDTDCRRH